jgi:hypothetical protein
VSELDVLAAFVGLVEPDVPVATVVVAAMTDPSPTNAAKLETAVILRARRAGCRRRRRRAGVARSAMCVSFVGRLARSVSAAPGTVLRDAWAVS